MMWPPPAPATPPTAPGFKPDVVVEPPPPPNYFMNTFKDSMTYSAGLGSIIGLGMVSPNAAFTTMVTTFGLAGIVG